MYSDTYQQVDFDFLKQIEIMVKENKEGKIHFFDAEDQLSDVSGVFKGLLTNDEGEYLEVTDAAIRLDKIITVLGKPGPAYDLYDSYANACLTCEDLGQF